MKKSISIKIFLLIFSLLLALVFQSDTSRSYAQSQNSQEEAVIDILFVGNSYTYGNNLPQVVMSHGRERDMPFLSRRSTLGGSNLDDHIQSAKGLETVEKIKAHDFEIVILQDQSMRPIRSPEDTIRSIIQLSNLVKKSGGVPYLFNTWARKHTPETQDLINETYIKAAYESGSGLIPVGQAWALALERNPEIELYYTDNSHPVPLGTYLAACVFYVALTGNSAADLSHHPEILDFIGEPVTLMYVDPELAAFCHQVANDTIKQLLHEHPDLLLPIKP